MLSPFQQTLTSVISLVYAGDLTEAVRLIETVDQTVSTKAYKVLNDAVRLMESRRPDPRMGEKVKDLLGPLLKPGAPVPDPVRFRAAVQELESQLQFAAEGDDAEARWGKIERNHDIVEACKAYAPNGKAREAINDIVTVLEARNREPARQDDPLLKQYYETAHRILEPFLRMGAVKNAGDPMTIPDLVQDALQALRKKDFRRADGLVMSIVSIADTPALEQAAEHASDAVVLARQGKQSVEAAMAALEALLRLTRTASEAPMENPATLPEWKQYIRSLSGPPLLSKALAANQVAFVRSLEEDGLTPSEIATVLRGFAVRLVEDDQAVPSRVEGSYVDYGLLAFPLDLNVESVPE